MNSVEMLGIVKEFPGIIANQDVDFVVESGSIHGLLGENGAGKSTLMKILSGRYDPDAGRMLIEGRKVRFYSPSDALRLGIGMLHQDPKDFPRMRVVDNFLLGTYSGLALDHRKAKRAFQSLAQTYGFNLHPDSFIGDLSIGERQQAEMLRLLHLGVKVLILDEPTTGISGYQKEVLFKALHKLAEGGRTIIFVSHKLEEVAQLCHKVTVMREGRVVATRAMPVTSETLVQFMFGQELHPLAKERVEFGAVLLRLANLTVGNGLSSLKNLTLDVHEGEILGLAGFEGSGQRQVLLAACGLAKIKSGSVQMAGENLTKQPYTEYLKRGVTFLPADRLGEGLIAGLSLEENLLLAHVGHLRLTKGPFIDSTASLGLAQREISDLRIQARPETLVEALSGGNQQRALLARFPSHPRLLVLEHPTRGLDVESSLELWSRLLARRKDGTAILFSSVDLEELTSYSDRILVFSGGEMIGEVEPSTVALEELGHLIGGRRR